MNPRAAAGAEIRHAPGAALARALQESRADTLATFAAYERARPDLQVPQDSALNPPLWELGHIGWFQQHWLGRNPQRLRGLTADPDCARGPAQRADADALYNSSLVAHATRWQLPLPDARHTREDVAAVLAQSLALLQHTPDDDTALYFHRLALLHEDMHHEAALYMAQALGVPVDDPRWRPPALPPPGEPLALPPGGWTLGAGGGGFAFDNEVGRHELALAAHTIGRQVLRWSEYLPFIEAGGYQDLRWWDAAGRAWLAACSTGLPRYLRRAAAGFEQQRQGRWQALDPAEPACHLSRHEALAWCAWAGRRLPTEAEWERAATLHPAAFDWGAVWEWTASPFEPYPGFVAHPYRDYSAPWFGSRAVLRGASFGTQPRMHHVRYRNFFPPERNDIFAGFRSCSA
jgi:iron(II)-dependent oxidoreductase